MATLDNLEHHIMKLRFHTFRLDGWWFAVIMAGQGAIACTMPTRDRNHAARLAMNVISAIIMQSGRQV